MAQATLKAGLRTLVLAPERAREARLIEGLEVAAVERLASAVRVLGGGPADALPEQSPRSSAATRRLASRART